MAGTTTDITESMRCPTCNATQTWSDECRRCKSDLRLLRRVIETQWQYRDRALRALRDGRELSALAAAQSAYDLYPDAKNRQLLATCQLLTGNWLQAMRLAR